MPEKGIFAKALTRVKIWASAIGLSGNPEDVTAVAIIAQGRIKYALTAGETLRNGQNSSAFQKLIDANECLRKIVEHNEKGEKFHKVVMAVIQIHEAIQVSKDKQNIYKNPEKAAADFDDLFMGFGKPAKKFPPPFDSTIGELREQCGTLRFFSNMQNAMADPNSNRRRAKALLNDPRD